MQRTNREQHNHISYFNPDVMPIEQAHQDFSCELKCFNAGSGYDNFNDFVNGEAAEEFYTSNGFNQVKANMQPLYCVDSEYTAMYLSLKEVFMNYDK